MNKSHFNMNGGHYRELAVIHKLQSELPQGYALFHGVTWQALHHGLETHGELDIVVLAPNGAMVILEVKAGSAQLRGGQLFKLYAQGGEKDIVRQSRVQYGAMVNKLSQAKLRTVVINALVLPDCALVEKASVLAYDAARIVDASVYDELASLVVDWVNDAGQRMAEFATQTTYEQLQRFLSNEFAVIADVSAQAGDLRAASFRLADGLASWIPRMSVPSGQIRVQGTAGSGKTQLALRVLDEAVQGQKRALYVCYNRSLADVMRTHASAKVEVVTFHELAIDFYRKNHDFSFDDGQVFAKASDAFVAGSDAFTPRLDVLIVDEGQDFEAEWVGALAGLLKGDGRLYLLEDEAQRLYARSEFDLPEATLVRCQDNFRSPRLICQTINALGLSPLQVNAMSPFEGEVPAFYVYDSPETLLRQTVKAVQDVLAKGFAIENVVVLSYVGQNQSKLFAQARDTGALGAWSVRYVTGFDDAGNVLSHEGEVQLETLYRFKGQSAVAVILSEVDFEQLGENDKRKLFVGLTRGLMSVSLVLSQRAEAAIVGALGG